MNCLNVQCLIGCIKVTQRNTNTRPSCQKRIIFRHFVAVVIFFLRMALHLYNEPKRLFVIVIIPIYQQVFNYYYCINIWIFWHFKTNVHSHEIQLLQLFISFRWTEWMSWGNNWICRWQCDIEKNRWNKLTFKLELVDKHTHTH